MKGRSSTDDKIYIKFYPETSVEEILFFGRAGYDSARITQGVINYFGENAVSCKCFGDEQVSATYEPGTHMLTLTMAGAYASITIISRSKIANA